jgi:hypothetical protein
LLARALPAAAAFATAISGCGGGWGSAGPSAAAAAVARVFAGYVTAVAALGGGARAPAALRPAALTGVAPVPKRKSTFLGGAKREVSIRRLPLPPLSAARAAGVLRLTAPETTVAVLCARLAAVLAAREAAPRVAAAAEAAWAAAAGAAGGADAWVAACTTAAAMAAASSAASSAVSSAASTPLAGPAAAAAAAFAARAAATGWPETEGELVARLVKETQVASYNGDDDSDKNYAGNDAAVAAAAAAAATGRPAWPQPLPSADTLFTSAYAAWLTPQSVEAAAAAAAAAAASAGGLQGHDTALSTGVSALLRALPSPGVSVSARAFLSAVAPALNDAEEAITQQIAARLVHYDLREDLYDVSYLPAALKGSLQGKGRFAAKLDAALDDLNALVPPEAFERVAAAVYNEVNRGLFWVLAFGSRAFAPDEALGVVSNDLLHITAEFEEEIGVQVLAASDQAVQVSLLVRMMSKPTSELLSFLRAAAAPGASPPPLGTTVLLRILGQRAMTDDAAREHLKQLIRSGAVSTRCFDAHSVKYDNIAYFLSDDFDKHN